MLGNVDYAIADVHGRADLLEKLVSSCVDDAASSGLGARFLFLGDLIDRGPASRDCLELVSEIMQSYDSSVLLRGNHEEMALAVVDHEALDADRVEAWMDRGGIATLCSYHVDPDIGLEVLRMMHGHHIRLLSGSSVFHDVGGYRFVHAGVNPERGMHEQSDRDMVWVRKSFTDFVGHLEKVVVHGHVVVGDRPVVTENRISLDTGACSTGRLTACAFHGSDVRFLQTDGSARRVVEVDPVYLDRGLGTCLDRPYALAA